MGYSISRLFRLLSFAVLFIGTFSLPCQAWDGWDGEREELPDEMEIQIPAGEPVEVQFRQTVLGGFKPKGVAINLELRGRSLLITAPNGLPSKGTAMLVRLQDGEEVLLVLKPDND